VGVEKKNPFSAVYMKTPQTMGNAHNNSPVYCDRVSPHALLLFRRS